MKILTDAAELEHYDRGARSEERFSELRQRLERVASCGGSWGDPMDAYLDSQFDSVSQEDVYSHVADRVKGGHVLQVGGTGLAVCKALLGGAARGTLVTPTHGELELTSRAARSVGVGEAFRGFVGFGERLEGVSDASVDVVVIEACLHHMNVEEALAEVSRVLRQGGRFGAFDPWHARLYNIGIKVFGKRDNSVDCRPLNPERLGSLGKIFPESEVRQHGPLVRYPIVAADKIGLYMSRQRVHQLVQLDDRFSSPYAALRRNGSTVAVLATKR